MKRRDLRLIGQTNTAGQLLISNKAEMTEFFKQWPSNTFTMVITIEKTTETSRPLLGYYYKKIVPDMQRIFWEKGEMLTQEQTDSKIVKLTPISRDEHYDEDAKRWETDYITPNQMDNQQLVFFIEQLKQIAATEYHYYIEDPEDVR